MKKIVIGCIADDFTGASDAASFIKKAGIRTLLVNGVPDKDMGVPEHVQAIVIALKTRTEKVEAAVSESLKAVQWLKKLEVICLYDKYCSTFDSTPEGNIGPIADAIMEMEKLEYTVLCPALPVNGRTVKDGILYVNGKRLDESPMKDHPLTPMWDADILKLMEPQSKYPVYKFTHQMYNFSRKSIMEEINRIRKGNKHCYIVPDYFLDNHAEHIARVFGHLTFLTGGSGILTDLGKRLIGEVESIQEDEPDGCEGMTLVLAGSCSVATLRQIEAFQEQGGYSVKVNPEALMNEAGEVERIWNALQSGTSYKSILVYSSEPKEALEKVQNKFGRETVAHAVENALAQIAQRAVDSGFRKIIVAGGETSGAITQQLGFQQFFVGKDVAPGVPVMRPVEAPDFRLVLKSGNFGGEDFFREAIEIIGVEEREDEHDT